MTKPELILNEGQEVAKNKLLEFISDPKQKYMCILGFAGTGKTTVLKQFEDNLTFFNQQRRIFNLSQYEKIYYCATTNKASSLFMDATTIHKLLHLKVEEDNATGEKFLVQFKIPSVKDAIIVIDECSMMDEKLHLIVDSSTRNNCKIIYVLDPKQLPPVGHSEAFVCNQGFTEATLTQPMRQDSESHLFKTCQSLRKRSR